MLIIPSSEDSTIAAKSAAPEGASKSAVAILLEEVIPPIQLLAYQHRFLARLLLSRYFANRTFNFSPQTA
jgi:hypothetical protein